MDNTPKAPEKRRKTLLLLSPPTDSFIHDTIAAHRHSELSYSEVGGTTESECPAGFASNHWKAIIGHGASDFQSAKLAIRNYRMLQLGWLSHVGMTESIANESLVCTLAKQFMVYSLNVAKIVSVDDELPNRFGFSYGTTREYPLVGEERFTVSICESTGNVEYEIYSFARPSSVATRLAWPWLRRVQRRFCLASAAAMREACLEGRDAVVETESSPRVEAFDCECETR